MNKYSQKIQKFLQNNFDNDYTEYSYDDNKIIQSIIDTFNIKNNNKLNLIKQEKINKMHSYDDVCLILIIYKTMYNENILQQYVNDINPHIFDNMDSFFEWYRMNQMNLNLKKILKNNLENSTINKYYNILYKPIESRKYLHEILYDNLFVSLDVVQHGECENLIYEVYSGNNVDVHLYCIDKDNDNAISKPNINYISQIINFFKIMFKKDIYVKLNIFYGKQKKILPVINNQLDNFSNKHNRFICCDNVNSGMSIKETIIVLWREEEFYKVLIHELIHFFDIDFYVDDNVYKKINAIFNKHINVIGFDRVNESYTEALAMLIHSAFFSVIVSNTKINKILSYEMLWTQFQVAKILNHYNCKTFDDIYNAQLQQYTSVCSYYIVKCFLMLNYNMLFSFWNKNGFFIISENKNSENEYVELYNKVIKFDNDKTIINKFIYYLNDNKHMNDYVLITLRMSMFQI